MPDPTDRDLDRRGPVLEVDLSAIAANHRTLLGRARAGTEISAVVKADAYGLGQSSVCQALWRAGCRSFWVNDLSEAVPLKQSLPDARVYGLHGVGVERLEDFVAAGIVPVLTSLAEVKAASAWALSHGNPISVAIHLETGLGRLGLPQEEITQIIHNPGLLKPLNLQCWVTHLAAFDQPDAPLNAQQQSLFDQWTDRLPAADYSLAASACLFRAEGWHYDIARVGSAHFGVQTSSQWQSGLKIAYRLTAPVIRVVDLPEGRSVGYRAAGQLTRPTRIATINLGYANGIPPAWFQSGFARVGGYEVPFIGGASMSLAMLDVTDIPDGRAVVGTRSVIFDDALPLERAAAPLQIATNALLTQIAGTTPKRYHPLTDL